MINRKNLWYVNEEESFLQGKGYINLSFYNELSTYYDQIFPFNQTAYSFVSQYFHEGNSILDMGAGTGTMAIALAEKGLQVIASEPEETMAETIKKKAKSKGLTLSVYTKSMDEIEEFQEQFDGILCIGNTLPHLSDIETVERYLRKCYFQLKTNGILILQQVNYDKVLSKSDFTFPVIEKEGCTFTREYEKKDEHILFTSRLSSNGETTENTIPLFPVTSQQLIPLLKKIGFQAVDVYGNFQSEKHSTESPALITVARK
jgi:glycine/sarcosine N-methyltransferase